MRDTEETEKKASRKHVEGSKDLISTESMESAEEMLAEAIDKTTKLVRKHPMEAIAVTFGVGCLVGILISRR